MRLNISSVKPGLHPTEAVVQVETIEGPEYVVVDQQAIKRNSIEIGQPVAQDEDHYLVELPSETVRGAWRVWVEKGRITEEGLEVAE